MPLNNNLLLNDLIPYILKVFCLYLVYVDVDFIFVIVKIARVLRLFVHSGVILRNYDGTTICPLQGAESLAPSIDY